METRTCFCFLCVRSGVCFPPLPRFFPGMLELLISMSQRLILSGAQTKCPSTAHCGRQGTIPKPVPKPNLTFEYVREATSSCNDMAGSAGCMNISSHGSACRCTQQSDRTQASTRNLGRGGTSCYRWGVSRQIRLVFVRARKNQVSSSGIRAASLSAPRYIAQSSSAAILRTASLYTLQYTTVSFGFLQSETHQAFKGLSQLSRRI